MQHYFLVLKVLLLSWFIGGSFVEVGACTAPTTSQFWHSNATSNSAQLFTTAEGIAFQFVYKPSTSSVWLYTDWSNTNIKTITGLAAGSTYQYAVSRQCSNGVWSVWSSVKTFTTQSATCSAPATSQLNATNITTTSARLESNLTGEQHNFRYRVLGTSTWINTPTTEYCYLGPWEGVQCVQINNLQPGTTYEYQGSRQCSNGAWSGWSSSKTFTTQSATCTAPTTSEFSASNLTANSAQLNTTAAGNAFQFAYKLSTINDWSYTDSQNTSSKTITGLVAGASYHYAVRRRCTNNVWSPWSSNKTFTTQAATCTAPTTSEFSVSNLTANSAQLNTTAAGNAFQFAYKLSTSSDWQYTGTPYTSPKTITGLVAGSTYHYAVRRQCSNGVWSPWSSNKTFTTQAATCTAPTTSQFSHGNVTANSATLTHTASGNLFQFRYRASGVEGWTHTSNFTGLSWNISSLSGGATHEYQLRRRCTNNVWSDWSSSKTFNTSCLPATTAQFWHSNVGSSSVTFHHAAQGTHFQFRHRRVGYSWPSTPSSFTGNSVTRTGLSAGYTYEYQFRRYCTSGQWSEWSVSKTFNTVCPEPPLTGFSHNNVTETSARLNRTDWGTEFQFRYRVQGFGGWTNTATFTGSFINITNLSSGTTYEYQFMKRCVSGDWGVWSASKIFGTVCPQLTTTQFWHTNLTPTSVTLVTNAAGVSYQFHYVYTGNGHITTASSSNAHTVSVSPGRTYAYRVRHICSNGGPWSAWSATRTFTTPSNFNLSTPDALVIAIEEEALLALDMEEDAEDTSEQTLQLPGIGAATPAKAEMAVFPNPTRGIVQFRFTGEAGGSLHLRLLNMQGQVVRTLVQARPFEGHADLQFDLSGLPGGTYLLQGKAGHTPVSERIIKMD